MSDERLSPQRRVRRAVDFQQVYDAGCHAADNVLVVHAAFNASQVTRLGLAVSRSVGNAVVRNRWKRRIREAFRRCRSDLPVGLDLVVRPRRGAVLDYQAIRVSLPKLARRLAARLAAARKPLPENHEGRGSPPRRTTRGPS